VNRARLCKLQKKGCTRLTAASDKVYQLLAHGRWFSPGTPASSTTKTGRHDIAECGIKQNKSNHNMFQLIQTNLISVENSCLECSNRFVVVLTVVKI
jgi:hypothetical protein